MNVLVRHAGAPLGQARLARDAGLANNTVAAGYVDLLIDLLCLGECLAWDAGRRVEIARKPAKFPFVNLLAATSHARRRVEERGAVDKRASSAG